CGPPVTATVSGGGYSFSLVSNQSKTGVDFGNYQNASISGAKFEDANADGSKTGDVGPTVAFTISVYKDNGSTAGKLDGTDSFAASTSTATDGTGSWSVTGLTPGNYIVCETQKAGWTQSAPTPTSGASAICGPPVTATFSGGGYSFSLVSNQSKTGVDFGNYTTGKVSGHKYEDPNADGDLSDGTGLSGWTIKVYTDAATPVFVTSTTTNGGGAYSFDLQPGKYLVCEVLEASFTQSAPPGTDCSGISGVADGGFKVTVTSSGTFAGNDFGNYTTGKVSGHKYEDPNADGDLSDGTGLSGWTIKLYTDAATLFPYTTLFRSGGGAYSFDLQPGDYLVCEVLKSLYTQ